MTETRRYNVTPEKLQGIAAKLQSNGIHFDPAAPTGEGDAHGFHVQWKLAPGQIEISMLKHPIIGAGMFWHAVEGELGPAI